MTTTFVMRSEHKSHFRLYATSFSQNHESRECQLFRIVRSLNFPCLIFLFGLRYLTPPGLFESGSRSKTGSLEWIILINHANFWTNDEFERFENFHHNRILEQRWQRVPIKPQQYRLDSTHHPRRLLCFEYFTSLLSYILPRSQLLRA